MYTVNMMSKADIVKGHGVLSVYEEQVALVETWLRESIWVVKNSREAAEITHYHSINPELYLTISRMKRKGVTVGYVHFLPETIEGSIRLPWIAKKIFYAYIIHFYKRMDYLVTVNPHFTRRLQEYGIAKEKIHYIPNFVSEEAFCPMKPEMKPVLREKYGLKPDVFTVVCAGQLQKRKGVMEFIEVAKHMPDMQFVWAGGFSFGKITDGYEEIRRIEKQLPENVRFTGMLDRSCMNEIYNMADVMFLPSYEELFPMAVLEAMSCHIPVLVRELEIYEPVLAGHVLTGRSNEEFIWKLTKLKKKADFYKEMTECAMAGQRRYSPETVARMWKNFYDSVVFCSSGIRAGEERAHGRESEAGNEAAVQPEAGQIREY